MISTLLHSWPTIAVASTGVLIGLATLVRAVAVLTVSRALNHDTDEKRRTDQLRALRILVGEQRRASVSRSRRDRE